LITSLIVVPQRKAFADYFKNIGNLKSSAVVNFINSHLLELIYILVILVVWSIYIFRSLYVKDGTLNIGLSVCSDFGATLPILRSFSLGSNFPTEYPHFAGGINTGSANDIRYHFLFQFLSGNLEFLGLRIDWAFNLPSIMAMVSFLMLLYAFTVMVMGKRIVAIIASILFLFRSSLAFFTNLSAKQAQGITSVKDLVKELLLTGTPYLNPDRAGHIGNPEFHSDWGFWAQKVYVNKRHYAYALGIIMLSLIIVFPLFRKMIFAFKK
jgi:hypothetical protein